MFVTLCTVLIPLVSYTPVTPRLLFILFTLGFLFALPAYIFLLPTMTHWLELALFIFAYAFIGFYVFQGPVSIFFLLGLFTLGIQNTMNYNVDAIMLSILMFYMMCATLIISIHFPFSSKPERIYASVRRRFFRHCARWIRHHSLHASTANWIFGRLLGNGSALLAKMESWGPQIDKSLLSEDGAQQIADLNRACDLLYGQLQVLALRRNDFASNPLVIAARQRAHGHPVAALCEKLARGDSGEELLQLQSGLPQLRNGWMNCWAMTTWTGMIHSNWRSFMST